ncbi:MAG: hypothetical protein LH481_04310, partial [Burkholderiales bacterium]|nr:hypothetical protein [Burkholderiales bacterium]
MKKYIVASILLTISASASAYERITHKDLSEAAARNSVLGTPKFLSQLGLAPAVISDTGLNRFATSEGGAESILELIKFGADWEDSRGEKVQATRHFFNPVTNEALSAGPFILPVSPFYIPRISGIRSPDWALEDVSYDPGILDLPQIFSYKYARSYFLKAITLPDKAARHTNWGLTFQSLGHVIHHIQDMAQPQHTRNDFHCDSSFCETTGLLGGEKPSYEKWTLNNPDTSQYSGYEPVYTKEVANGFTTPRMFWIGGGKGIAEFTNRNFFTAGTNVDAAGVVSPQLIGGPGQKIGISTLCNEASLNGQLPCPLGLRGNVTFFATNVTDTLRIGQGGVNQRATTRSIFDADLKKRFLGREAYSVNRFTYAATNDFTLKRAVGYSAGMINFFFRGELSWKRAAISPTQFAIKNKGPDDMNGEFSLFYDAADGTRYPVPSAKWTLSITAGQESAPIDVELEVSPPPAKSNAFILVFNGKMGSEENAVAVTAVDVQPPIEGLYVLASDDVGAKVFLRVNKKGTRVLLPDEFSPFQSASVPSGSGRKYLQKQIAFLAAPDGKPTHMVQSLTTYNGTVKNMYFDADGKLNVRTEISGAGPIAWVSRPETNHTPDLYTFWLDVNGQFRWERQSNVAIGGPVTRGGVTLPDKFMGQVVQYFAVNFIEAVISADGLTLYGLTIADLPVTNGVDTRGIKLQVSIGEQPSASLVFDRDYVSRTYSRTDEPFAVADIGSISATSVSDCPSGNTVLVQSIIKRETESTVANATATYDRLIGYIDGKLERFTHVAEYGGGIKRDTEYGSVSYSPSCLGGTNIKRHYRTFEEHYINNRYQLSIGGETLEKVCVGSGALPGSESYAQTNRCHDLLQSAAPDAKGLQDHDGPLNSRPL